MRVSQEGKNLISHNTASQVEPVQMPALRDIIGVTRKSYDNWNRECEAKIVLIDEASHCIMKRPFREKVLELTNVIKDILVNCRHDPDDIREEIGLPTILNRLAVTLDQYVQIVSRRVTHDAVRERMQESERSIERAVTFLKELLTKMKANDARDALSRADVLSRIFDVRTSELGSKKGAEIGEGSH